MIINLAIPLLFCYFIKQPNFIDIKLNFMMPYIYFKLTKLNQVKFVLNYEIHRLQEKCTSKHPKLLPFPSNFRRVLFVYCYYFVSNFQVEDQIMSLFEANGGGDGSIEMLGSFKSKF